MTSGVSPMSFSPVIPIRRISTARGQVKALARAGSELVRVTVNNDESAAAVPHIRDRLDAMNVRTPLVGDSTSTATNC